MGQTHCTVILLAGMLLWCTRLNITMQTKACTDRVVGDILSSWRYDISGITPEMRRDYEQHLVECAHCCSRQRLHRTVDVALISLSTVSIAAFLLGLAVIHRIQPLQHWALLDLHLWQMPIVLSLQAAAGTHLASQDLRCRLQHPRGPELRLPLRRHPAPATSPK